MKAAREPGTGPLVTIAIPTYNRAGTYLGAALQSALGQSYPGIEVLVSDNASTDETPALVRRFADPRLRYIRHDTDLGANRNFNYCLERAAGHYFLLLHDDDLIDPDFVESCLEAAEYRTHFGMIRTGIRIIDGEGNLVRECPNRAAGCAPAEYFRAWFAGKTTWYLANTLFHTAYLRSLGGFHSRRQLVEDGFAIARLAALFPRVDVVEVKSSFRVHLGEKTFADQAVAWGEDYLDLLDCLCGLVPANDAARLRREGRRYFARLTYNRASAIRAPIDRMRAYLEVCRLFRFRHYPTERFVGRRFIFRAIDHIRRVWEQASAHSAPPR